MELEEFDERMESASIDLKAAIQNRLKPGGRGYHDGNLSRSIEVIVISGRGLEISMETYGGYIENGTPNPTTPEEILQWVKDKIIPKLRGKKKSSTASMLAKRIAKHITLFGPRPYPFIRLTLAQDWPLIKEKNGL